MARLVRLLAFPPFGSSSQWRLARVAIFLLAVEDLNTLQYIQNIQIFVQVSILLIIRWGKKVERAVVYWRFDVCRDFHV